MPDGGGDKKQPELRISEDQPQKEEPVIRLDQEDLVQPESKSVRSVATPTENLESALGLRTESDLELLKEANDPEKEWLEETKEKQPQKVPMGWFALIGLVILGAIGWSFFQMDHGDSDTAGPPLEETPDTKPLEILSMTAAERAEAMAYNERIDTLLKNYFAAKTPDDLSGLIRHEERVMPLIKAHHLQNAMPPRTLHRIEKIIPVSIKNRPFRAINALFTDGSQVAVLMEDLPGSPQIDWESHHAHQPMDPEHYIATRPTTPVKFRVYAQRDHYYAHEYADENRFQSYRLTFRDYDAYLIGVVERGSDIAAKLDKIFINEKGIFQRTATPILKVQFEPGTSAPKSVRILEITSPLWPYLKTSDAD